MAESSPRFRTALRRRRRAPWLLLPAFAVAALSPSAAAVPRARGDCWPTGKVTCLATPEQAVLTFYHGAARHDLAKVRAATAPQQRKVWASDQLEEIGNLRSLRHLLVTTVNDRSVDGLPSEIDPKGYDRWADVVVSFDADYRKVITSRDGKQIRFVFMGRDAKTGNWQFFESGTGP